MKKNFVNTAKCRNCGDILVSTHRHDFAACSCYLESQKIIQNIPYNKQITKKGNYRKSFLKILNSLHGIAIDGGSDYCRRLFYNSKDFIDLSK